MLLFDKHHARTTVRTTEWSHEASSSNARRPRPALSGAVAIGFLGGSSANDYDLCPGGLLQPVHVRVPPEIGLGMRFVHLRGLELHADRSHHAPAEEVGEMPPLKDRTDKHSISVPGCLTSERLMSSQRVCDRYFERMGDSSDDSIPPLIGQIFLA